MRLLLFNLVTDIDDPILGFTTQWIRALAKQVEFIHVVTMRAGHVEVPDNVRVYSVGKEKGYSEARRSLEFFRVLHRILSEERIDVCFSHMMPLFTVLAGPVLKLRRIPTVTWYAHPSLTCTLRAAHHLSTHMVTSVATAYPYKTGKLIVIGQGVDTDLFSPDSGASPPEPPMILCAGRLSPVKNHPTLLEAVSRLRRRWTEPFRVVIIGGPGSPRDESYIRSLREQMVRLELADAVHFEAPASMASLPTWYRRCTVHVNLTPTGFGDKVALEAMACAKPSLAANRGFEETFGKFADRLLFRYKDAEHLADALLALLKIDARDREEIGRYLRQRVVQMHSLNNLACRLTEVFQRVRQCRAGSISPGMNNEEGEYR